MTILSNPARIGSFTSSEIYNLLKKDRSGKGFGVPALTYIEERNMARRLGRSLTTETNSRPTTWGKCLEPFAFQKLGFDYGFGVEDGDLIVSFHCYDAGSHGGVIPYELIGGAFINTPIEIRIYD